MPAGRFSRDDGAQLPTNLIGAHEPQRDRMVKVTDVRTLFRQVADDGRGGEQLGVDFLFVRAAATAATKVPGAIMSRSRKHLRAGVQVTTTSSRTATAAASDGAAMTSSESSATSAPRTPAPSRGRDSRHARL